MSRVCVLTPVIFASLVVFLAFLSLPDEVPPPRFRENGRFLRDEPKDEKLTTESDKDSHAADAHSDESESSDENSGGGKKEHTEQSKHEEAASTKDSHSSSNADESSPGAAKDTASADEDSGTGSNSSADDDSKLDVCVDDKRVHVDFTNETCAKVSMFTKPANIFLYLSCGPEAYLRWITEFHRIAEGTTILLKICGMAVLSAICPAVASSVIFQAFSGSPKKKDYDALPDGDTGASRSCFASCARIVGQLKYVVAAVVIGMQAYTCFCTVRRFLLEWQEMRSQLNYGGWCNFFLTMDYAYYKEILEVLVLATFSVFDVVFVGFKGICDCFMCLSAEFCNIMCTLKFLICCKCCALLSCKCFCAFLLLLICIVPLMIILYLTLGSLAVYQLFAIASVIFVYGGLLLMASVLLALGVYVLMIIPSAIAGTLQGPLAFYEGVFERIGTELSPSEELSSPDKIYKAKIFGIFIPFILLLVCNLEHTSASMFVESYGLANVDLEEYANLTATTGRDSTVQGFVDDMKKSFGATTAILYIAFVETPGSVPAMIEKAKYYFSARVLWREFKDMINLQENFEKFRNAVLGMRICTGLLIGPLKMLETMSEM